MAIVLLGAMSTSTFAQNTSAPHEGQQAADAHLAALPANPNDYVRNAITHELEEQDKDHALWRYHLHREDEKNNVDRDVIQTREGQLSRTLLLWGKPLSKEERENDQARMQKQVSDPEERARHEKREKEDDAKARQMLQLIPQAFFFKYDGEGSGVVRLSFTPNPRFDPPNFESKVYRSLKGFLWIDRENTRLAGMDGTLFEDVNFGWGILGHLNKGGTFSVKQKDVGENHWEVISEEVNMNGRAVLFKTITRKQKQTRTEFRRVPNTMTIQQAYQILQQGEGSVTSEIQNHSQLRQVVTR
jgi:hypothetical protein